jgi:hypothetical protein
MNVHPKIDSDAYVLLNGVLYWRSKGVMWVYVPMNLRTELMREFHDLPIAGHRLA